MVTIAKDSKILWWRGEIRNLYEDQPFFLGEPILRNRETMITVAPSTDRKRLSVSVDSPFSNLDAFVEFCYFSY